MFLELCEVKSGDFSAVYLRDGTKTTSVGSGHCVSLWPSPLLPVFSLDSPRHHERNRNTLHTR